MSIFKNYSKAFWTANVVELLERAAYYGVFIVITLYLSNVLGFTDVQAALISGIFSAGLYLLPLFSGAYADKIGFRKAMMLAFTLLTIGYVSLGILPTVLESAGLVSYAKGADEKTIFHGIKENMGRWSVIPIMLLVMIGGSFIKSVISGTVAKETTAENRAKGFSIFYMMVNIGAFSGKTIVDPLRRSMGDTGLIVLNYFSAGATLLALVLIFFFYKSTQANENNKTIKEIWQGLGKVLTNGRLMALILIISGFWLVQGQMYATMPKYVLRMAGDSATPGWYANVNPLIVVLCVNFVTHLMRKRKAITSMFVGMCILPLSAFVMALGNIVGASEILGLHPIAFMMVVGIAIQGFAETFISPRYLEYFSLQAPKGEEGLYLGFSHLHSFFSWIFAFIISGFLLESFCPDPAKFATHELWQEAAKNAHYIWFVFVGIALVSALALYIYSRKTEHRKA